MTCGVVHCLSDITLVCASAQTCTALQLETRTVAAVADEPFSNHLECVMRKFFVLAVLCAASVGARAETTFAFEVIGSGYVGPDGPLPYIGTALLTLNGGGDGTYNSAQGGLIDFAFSGQIDGRGLSFDLANEPSLGNLTATVLDGYASVYGRYGSFCGSYGRQCLAIDGRSFTYTQTGGPIIEPSIGVSATLVPIPEPSTWAMLGMGLFAIVHRQIRRRPSVLA